MPDTTLVLADSDIGVSPNYLARVTAPLDAARVGAVTVLYRGTSVGGRWADIAALAVDAHFLPSVVAGLRLGIAKPCFGSTIALRRDALQRIGGFTAFADDLADDYQVGAALRTAGYDIVIPDMLVEHIFNENSFLSVWNHEIRWARTIRAVDPIGYFGSVVTHPLGWAALAVLTGALAPGLLLGAIALLCRVGMTAAVAWRFGFRVLPLWLLPCRDLLSCAVFFWSFTGRNLVWRGTRFRTDARGRLTGE